MGSLPVQIPRLDPAEITTVRLLGDLVQTVKDELCKGRVVLTSRYGVATLRRLATHLDVLPVLHLHDIELIRNDNLDGRQEV
jgi:hypothetical protein